MVKPAGGVTQVGVVDGRNIQDQAMPRRRICSPAIPTCRRSTPPASPRWSAPSPPRKVRGAPKDQDFGWDLSPQAIGAIDAGYLVGVVQQDPYQEGQKAIEALDTLANGGKVEKAIKVPVTIVTKANVDKFRAAFK